MNNVVAANGAPVIPSAPPKEVQEGFKQAFGLSDDDINKYGSK